MYAKQGAALIGLSLVFILGGCGGDDGAVADASTGTGDPADADPSAPDADPEAPDADTGDLDADVEAPDADVEEGVSCGDQTCGPDTECCAELGDDLVCVDLGECDGATLECTSPSDCEEGDVCCVTGTETTCVPEEDCDVEVCEVDDDCTDENHECCGDDDFSVCSPFCL